MRIFNSRASFQRSAGLFAIAREGCLPRLSTFATLSAKIRGKPPRHAALRREKSSPSRRTWKVGLMLDCIIPKPALGELAKNMRYAR